MPNGHHSTRLALYTSGNRGIFSCSRPFKVSCTAILATLSILTVINICRPLFSLPPAHLGSSLFPSGGGSSFRYSSRRALAGHVVAVNFSTPALDEEHQSSFHHPFNDSKYKIYRLDEHDESARCQGSGICDGNYTCVTDGLGCVRSSKQRQEHIRAAAQWSWLGYR